MALHPIDSVSELAVQALFQDKDELCDELQGG
jgi:hypothetical protein